MNYFMNRIWKVTIILFLSSSSLLCMAQSSYTLWEQNFQKALKTSDVGLIKDFFQKDFGKEEIESWKYQLKRNHLNFTEAKVFQLDTLSVLMYIPTNNNAYDGDNHDEYFDFIYRIYKIENLLGKTLITKRYMNEINPDFLTYDLDVNIEPTTKTFTFESEVSINLKTPHLIFKLAKNFNIKSFLLNGKEISYKRFGYIVYCKTNSSGIYQLKISGNLKSPDTNNQFISMGKNNFFVRFGGFSAIPSPPPNNTGRNFFSKDSTKFSITYKYPEAYTLLQYGNIIDSKANNGIKDIKTSINGTWMDNIAFYAQSNWEKKEIIKGDTHIGFYFKKTDIKERDYIISEVNQLLNWINTKFNSFGKFSINFVVLDNFVKEGLLNDSHSIIAQNAEIIGTGGMGYLHEVSHGAPQPTVEGNYLWIKEGFTNFLSFEYLHTHKNDTNLWKNQKRKYLHCFDLYEEPLEKITSTSIPTYWATYSKGALVYRVLETIMGPENFKKALFKLGEMKGTNLSSVDDYIKIFENVSGRDLQFFKEQWLQRKENPVLNVQTQLETVGNNSLLKIIIRQEDPIFTFPLEINIKTENENFRKIISIENKVTEFTMPIKAKTITIEYDPDARIFAIIKDHKKTFTQERCNYQIPTDTLSYTSKDNETEMQVWFSKKNKDVSINIKSDNSISILKLSDKLSPVRYIVKNDTIFSQNIENKTIQFKNNQYHLAEPVYPKEFIPFLFSMLDWGDIDELSMVYLKHKSSNVITCRRIKTTDNGFKLEMKYPIYDDIIINIETVNGVPCAFKTIGGVDMFLK